MIVTASLSLCVALADAAVEAADAAQRGQPLTEIISTIDTGLEEDAALIMRKFVISAYEAGKNNGLQNIHDAYYQACAEQKNRT